MEREASPDWLRDFKSPTDDAFMILSSSPSSSSRELPEKVSASKVLAEVNPVVDEIEEDSPLVSALGAGEIVKGAGSKGGTPKKRGRPPGTGKNQKNKGKSVSAAVEEEVTLEDEDDDDAEEKVVSSRRKRGGKRRLDSDEDEEEFKPPKKITKTAVSPKVKKEVTKTPKSSRKNKRVSISEDEEIATLKKVKRAIELQPKESAVDEDDDEDETAPISKLSSVAKTGTQPAVDPSCSDSAAVARSTECRSGTNTLRALMEDEVVDEDGLGVSQKEDLIAGEETGEPSERKTKRSLSNLQVMFADKIHRTKVLLECECDALDLSGDMGAVGRFTVSGRDDGEDELFLDLKGVVYKTTIVPSNTFFVVNVGQTEAKVEAIMNDFMQLRPDVNQAGDETVVEGTLEGFAFELDNEGDGGAAPNSTPAPVDDDDEDYDEKLKKKSPTKGQGKKVTATKGGKGKAKASGKGGAKKPRAKAKTAAKKPPKAKPVTVRKPKAAKAC